MMSIAWVRVQVPPAHGTSTGLQQTEPGRNGRLSPRSANQITSTIHHIHTHSYASSVEYYVGNKQIVWAGVGEDHQ